MKKLAVFLSLFLSAPVCAAPPSMDPSDGMKACTTSEECIAITNICGNSWLAINKKYEDSLREGWTDIAVKCANTPLPPKPDATCENGACRIGQ